MAAMHMPKGIILVQKEAPITPPLHRMAPTAPNNRGDIRFEMKAANGAGIGMIFID